MSVVESVLYLAVVPAAIYGVIVLIAMWPKLTRARYSAGQDWDFAPVFWSANPQGVNTAVPADGGGEVVPDDARPGTARGGARGNW